MNKYNKLIEDLGRHSQASYPLEACGIITKDLEFVPCVNISWKPKHSFILDPVKLMEYDGDIWAVFHSHPGEDNPYPSEEDLKNTLLQKIKYVVGFGNKFYIYWYNEETEFLRYESFQEHHSQIS
jgi:proteasome lid subunit RPN8/RPN11